MAHDRAAATPNKPGGLPRVDNRRVLNGIFWVLRSATPWRDLPERCLGRSRGGLTTKIHVAVDAQGLPIRLGLTAGPTYDGQIANRLLDHLGPRTIVLADKAYDADRIRELIEQQGAMPNIPPRRHSIRQARRQLPRHGSARLNAALAPRL
jgi:transposase